MKKFLFPVKFFLFIFEFIFKPQIQQQTKAPNFSHPAKHFRKVVQRRSEIMNEHATCVNTFAIIIFIFCEIILLRYKRTHDYAFLNLITDALLIYRPTSARTKDVPIFIKTNL